jgi:hypothetical protein
VIEDGSRGRRRPGLHEGLRRWSRYGRGRTPSPTACGWGVAILDPGGQTIEVDTPSGWTLPDWRPTPDRYHRSGYAVMPIAGLPKPRASANLDKALADACDGAADITPAQFRALLSPEDVAASRQATSHRGPTRLCRVIHRADPVGAAGLGGGAMTGGVEVADLTTPVSGSKAPLSKSDILGSMEALIRCATGGRTTFFDTRSSPASRQSSAWVPAHEGHTLRPGGPARFVGLRRSLVSTIFYMPSLEQTAASPAPWRA